MSPTHAPENHSHHERPGHGPALGDDTDLAEFLNLDGVLGAPVLAAALNAAADALGTAPRTVVDLGAGTGTGTLALAAQFQKAQIHSLDASPLMLDRLAAAALTAGVDDRIETHVVDLDGDWPAVLPHEADLAWAALSLHHVTDPARVLSQTFEALRLGGVLVVTEVAGVTTYDPADLGTGRVGLGERIVGALAAHGYPVTADWTIALAEAGFAPVERHASTFTASARTTDGARYLALQLTMSRARLTEDLSADDLTALDAVITALVAGTSEVVMTSGRFSWIAVRPRASCRGH